jgi:nicotinamidase-related amidase
MASVIRLLHPRQLEGLPTLILIGLHQSQLFAWEPLGGAALRNCGMLLASARACQLSVAFVRCLQPLASISEARTYPVWLRGFEPRRDDMIFDITQPSCYSNDAFAQAMEHGGGGIAIAGLSGEAACLSTAMDACHRRHDLTYLSDASVCVNSGSIPRTMFHQAVSQIISGYAKVSTSEDWRRSLAQIKKAAAMETL